MHLRFAAIREDYVKGNVKVICISCELPQSVKVREGYVKSDVKVNNKDNTRV